jgi:hypothetical protein
VEIQTDNALYRRAPKADKPILKSLEKHVRGDGRKLQLAETNHYLKRTEVSSEQPCLNAQSSRKNHQKPVLQEM